MSNTTPNPYLAAKTNIEILYEDGKIKNPTVEEALSFCKNSKVGEHKCNVQTRYGWCCDLCLEEELLYLRPKGVLTVNSCCGHGDKKMATILVIGENSEKRMAELGYKKINKDGNITWWQAKSQLIYDLEGTKEHNLYYRYYSTQRPVSLGTYPTYGAKEIHNFDEKTYCPEISRSAWGYIDYNRILSKAETESYELVYAQDDNNIKI